MTGVEILVTPPRPRSHRLLAQHHHKSGDRDIEPEPQPQSANPHARTIKPVLAVARRSLRMVMTLVLLTNAPETQSSWLNRSINSGADVMINRRPDLRNPFVEDRINHW
jgi:hypothetical protein